MSVRVLIVCGGSGRGLLGQREALGFDAEIQIDVQREILAAGDQFAFRIPLDANNETCTTRQVLHFMQTDWDKRGSERAKRHAQVLYKYYPAAGVDLANGLAQAPAIGGGALLHEVNERKLVNALRQIVSERGQHLGPNEPLEVWIVSSTAGGTGAGVHRRVGWIISDFMSDQPTTVNLHFIMIGQRSFFSVGREATSLNTFFCIAADAAFVQKVSLEYKRVAPYFYFLEVPDVGKGEAAKPLRENLIETSAKAALLDEVQMNLISLCNSSPSKFVFLRVGFWGAEFDERQTRYEVFKDLHRQFNELINPLPSRFTQGDADFVRSTLLEEAADALIADSLLGHPEWRFPGKPRAFGRRLAEDVEERYLEECERALDELLLSLSPQFALNDLGGKFTIAGERTEPRDLAVVEPQPDSSWPEIFRHIQDAHWVVAWCQKLLRPDPEENRIGLEAQYRDLANKCSATQQRFWVGAATRARDLAPVLPEFLEVAVQRRILKELERTANRLLGEKLARVKPVAEKMYAELRALQSAHVQRSTSELVVAADLCDELDRLNHRTWFEMLERAVRFGDARDLREAIRKGAVGLTRLGLVTVVGLPEDAQQDISVVRDKVSEKAGGMLIEDEEQEGIWWQSDNITGLADTMYRYRIFPKLDEATSEALGEGQDDITFLSTPVGAIGMRVMAVDFAILDRGIETITAPTQLVKNLIGGLQRTMALNWPSCHQVQVGKDSGLIRVATAAVIGEPLFRPILEEEDLGLTDEEKVKLEYLFEMYDPNVPS